MWHFKFSKVVQAHTFGEVGILDTVFVKGLFRDTPSIFFIEIGSYLADMEQKISWHSFLDTVYTILQHKSCTALITSNKNAAQHQWQVRVSICDPVDVESNFARKSET